VLAGCLGLERVAGRFPFHVVPAAAGLAMVAGGVVIHGWSRRTLGPIWSGVVQVRAQHPLVDRGPYRFVRHPGYVGAILANLGTPVLLGSWRATLLGVIMAILMIVRTALEDRTLQNELHDYIDYAQRVRYRLLPGVW
jgi:protein-S-isoprenylcysteine O-methyltransferase Ste14